MSVLTYEKIDFEHLHNATYERGDYRSPLNNFKYVVYDEDVAVAICNIIHDDGGPRSWMPLTHQEITRHGNDAGYSDGRRFSAALIKVDGNIVFNSVAAERNGDLVIATTDIPPNTHPVFNCYGVIGDSRTDLERVLFGHALNHNDEACEEPDSDMPDIF